MLRLRTGAGGSGNGHPHGRSRCGRSNIGQRQNSVLQRIAAGSFICRYGILDSHCVEEVG